ncbi:uncharacterized protein LOC142323761 [Lycorma delicatula]|uniref:uncharacterized protein LOC142323761 n=1 Tax=Lycorma delicatula TaxID=130591 RepID=UPI003F5113CD
MDKKQLRFITYMCPSHPVELYELIMHYLEEKLGCEAYLIYESRSSGPLPGRIDPFTKDIVDIAFLSAEAYIEIIEKKRTDYAELLPVAAVFKHPKNRIAKPGYYSDIIIHTDVKEHVKEFLDLRGCLWAYNNENSLSGSTIILKTLKDLGENATFFGNSLKSGSHLQTLRMVVNKQAQAGAVDANSLQYQRQFLHDGGKDIYILDSLGPLPPYPILINSRLDAKLKTKITEALLEMTKTGFWGERFAKFGIQHFTHNSPDNYMFGKEILDNAKKTGIGIRYY